MDFGRRNQGPRRIGQPVNASMHMVTQRISCIVLHVSNQDIVPIHNVEGTIWGSFHIYGSKISIRGYHEILPPLRCKANRVIQHLVLLGTQKSDGIVDDQIALNILWKMAARNKLHAGGWAHHVVFFDEVGPFEVSISIAG